MGTFTGYSSICIARGLAAGGRLLCCDVSEEWTSVARRYWAGPASPTASSCGSRRRSTPCARCRPSRRSTWCSSTPTRVATRTTGDELVPRVRPGGVLLVDNVLRGGSVADDGDTGATDMRAFNDMVSADERVEVVMLPLADGVTVAVRR